MKKLSPVKFFVLLIAVSMIIFWIDSQAKKYSALPYYGNGKIAMNKSQRKKQEITPVKNFSFTNQYGKRVDENFIKNKVWVADVFFTNCPGICPRMSNNLKTVQEVFKDNHNVKILSVTCDPEHDGVAELKAYADMYKADGSQWQFATGDKKELYRFSRKDLQIVATEGDGGPDDFIHSQNLVLIDREGFIRGYYDGTSEDDIKKLVADIIKLL